MFDFEEMPEPEEVGETPAEDTPAEEVAEIEAEVETPAEEKPADPAPVDSPEMQAAAARIVELEARVVELQARVAGYELSTALAANGLPQDVGPMVSALYAASCAFIDIGMWLANSLADETSPIYPLGRLRAQPKPTPKADPRKAADKGATSSAPVPGKPMPSFLASPRS